MKTRHILTTLALTLSFALTGAVAQTRLNSSEIAESLQGVSQLGLTAASLRQAALDNVRKNPGQTAVGRPLLLPQLENEAQFTVEIDFDFNSAAIRPQSYRAVGLIADSLHHPVLLGYKFLVIGHTDAVGGREYNLKLSQRRAEAIREALINPFGVDPVRLEAVGLGEEQLRDPSRPDSQINRRVQLVNIGKAK
jgi:outer membrane protein OmpA-like peptidoglycan-associated protein